MNKTEAREFLGVSERTLESYVKKGRLTVSYVRGKTSQRADFAADDLQRLKDELETPVSREATEVEQSPQSDAEPPQTSAITPFRGVSNQGQGAGVLAIAAHDFPALVAAIRETPQKGAEVPISERNFLSVDESASLLGISKGALEKAIKADEIKVHTGLARGKRIKRADLKKWADKQ